MNLIFTHLPRFKLFIVIFIFQFSIFNSFSQPNTWTQQASFPGMPRVGAVSFTIGSKAYVGTGQDSSSNLLADFWEYDPATNMWTQLADFGGTPRRGAVGFSFGSKGYIGTGSDSTGLRKDFWEYDPVSGSWTQKTAIGGSATTNARKDAAAFQVNNFGYVVSGYDGSINSSKECWQYDGDTTWIRKADLGTSSSNSQRRWAVGFAIDTIGFIGCGFNSSQDWKKDFWKFNPANNTWTQKADFGGSARASAVSFTIGRKGFIGTGNNDQPCNDFWQYDPASNVWNPVADYPGGAIAAGIGFSVNGTGYAGLGTDTLSFRNDLWSYTPDSTIGINEPLPGKFNVRIFPNPFRSSGTLQIETEHPVQPGEFTFTLFDSNGNKIREESIRKNSWTLERKNLASGIYFYAVKRTDSHILISSGKIVID
jgi:N-acetylneuraminic acid mutarotase